uniref:Uncharacterized protein n=1 Tax=Tanacetum cinerariifolium TaxID=118510 RepID=A0A699JLZ5_TANCI|nr:hypothetical protein [Tanacetum cinerariifolium]
MMKRIGELKHIMADLIQDKKRLEKRLDSHGARLYTLEQLDIHHQVSKAIDKVVTNAVDWAMQVPLRNRFRHLPEADMKEILHQRMWEIDSYKSQEDHMQLYEALEKSMNRDHPEELAKDLDEPPPPPPPAGPSRASGSPGASGSSQVMPLPPPPPSTNQKGQSKGSAAPSSSKIATLSSDDEDIRNAHILRVNLGQDWWKPLEEERPTTPDVARSILSFDVPVLTNNWASTLASNYLPPLEDLLLAQTGDIAMFIDCKGGRPALSISKIKAAYYPDVGLEKMSSQDSYADLKCCQNGSLFHVWIDEALDYRVKEFKINRMNPGLNMRFQTRKYVDRSKAFMFAIQKQLKTRRIFCNLESFVGGQVRDGDYRLLKRTE